MVDDALEVNRQIARRLRQIAELLAGQEADQARVGGYRRAARAVESLGENIAELFARGGAAALDGLAGVSGTIAATIEEMITTGHSAQLERLRGAAEAERVLMTLPGVGPTLARRIHDGLHVETLEELELAAHDGRLERLPGVGSRRAAALRAAVADTLARVRDRRQSPDRAGPEPGVALLLDVDREYRTRARSGTLPLIAPRRFNPTGSAHLPILHTERGAWHLTALFSNTPRAHQLGKTHDWVILYYAEGNHAERQCTVVTETRGVLAGRRVVRGREGECLALVDVPPTGAPPARELRANLGAAGG